MTRRDYVTLAEALALVRPYERMLAGPEVWARCARNVANVLSAGNPKFDRARFLRACGDPTPNRG